MHSCDDLSLSVQLRDQTQITHGLSSRITAFSLRLNDGEDFGKLRPLAVETTVVSNS